MGRTTNIEFVVALFTFFGALYVSVVMSIWVYILRKRLTPLTWLFISIASAKAAICLWALSIIVDINPMPARILIMISVFIQIVVTIVMLRRRQWRVAFWR